MYIQHRKSLFFVLLVFQLAACATSAEKIEQPKSPAVTTLSDLAAAGDAHAMNQLGVDYEFGTNGLSQDYRKAEHWLRQAAAAHNAEAAANLGNMYLAGTGVPKDLNAARNLFEQASSAGNLMATCNLAGMLVEGSGGAQDLPRAWPLMTKAADAGVAECQTTLGLAFLYRRVDGNRNLASAKKYLLLAAAQGEPSAKAAVAGIVLDENREDEAKMREAFASLGGLAESGVIEADLLLGKACLSGTPWPPDGACARQHLEKASNNGFPRNGGILGIIYQTDFGGPSSLVAAERWFRVSLAAGETYPYSDLGRLLMHEDRAVEAVPLLLTAASQYHDTMAMYLLRRHCDEQRHCTVSGMQMREMRQELDALSADGRNNLAWRLATDPFSDAVDARYAIHLATTVLETNSDWHYLGTFAAALARAGDFSAAQQWQRRSIAAMPTQALSLERKQATVHLDLFKSGQTIDWY